MFIEFGKVNIMLTLITSIFTFILKKSYYAYAIFTYVLMIGLHTLSLINIKNENITKYTSIPAYSCLFILICMSFFVLYKSNTTGLSNKIISLTQLLLSIIIMFALKYGKSRFEILNENYINYIPTLFFIGFLISVSIIKDNQLILGKTYTEHMRKLRKLGEDKD